ncbi:MAG: winged helix-turn-helix transcriptional regulator [Deltaproteobacteria bacterium]|nr:winged helix-turn-helix transcriptional regulator [Deltaproteobacteria bacterium]
MTDEHTCCSDLKSLISPGFFKALGDPNRVAILASLAERGCELRVSEVADCCPVDLSVVSRHLRQLRDQGLLRSEKRGKEVYYTARIPEIVALFRELADALESCCPEGERRTT